MTRCRMLAVVWALLISQASVLRAADPPPAPVHPPAPHAQPQPYIVLKGQNVGQTYGVSSPAYAYGWFGVCPRARHVYDGTGYYGHYNQSSLRRGY